MTAPEFGNDARADGAIDPSRGQSRYCTDAHDDDSAERRSVRLERVATGRPEEAERREATIRSSSSHVEARGPAKLKEVLTHTGRETHSAGAINAESADEDGTLIGGAHSPGCLLSTPTRRVDEGLGDLNHPGCHIAVSDQIGGTAAIECLPGRRAITRRETAWTDWADAASCTRHMLVAMEQLPVDRLHGRTGGCCAQPRKQACGNHNQTPVRHSAIIRSRSANRSLAGRTLAAPVRGLRLVTARRSACSEDSFARHAEKT